MEEIIQTLQNNAKDEQAKDSIEEDETEEDSKPGVCLASDSILHCVTGSTSQQASR